MHGSWDAKKPGGKWHDCSRTLGKLDVWKMAEVKYLGYLQDAEYTDLKNGYQRLGKSLWRFYETVQQ